MDRESREKQTPIEFRCRKILSDVERSTDVSPAALKNVHLGDGDDSGSSIASPTPEKSDRKLSSKAKGHNNSSSRDILSEEVTTEITLKFAELPDKLKSLADLFDRMISSLRLLDLRKRVSSFRNICTQVEIMTKRKFSYGHLAQMKYILPDAIQIEKILVHDERSLCMTPDLKISIIFDIMEFPSYPGQSKFMALCHAFRIKLLKHFNANQDAEISEAVLPEPFNQRNDMKYMDCMSEESLSDLPKQASVELDSLLSASHFSSSFRKKFFDKMIIPEAERTGALASGSTNMDDTEVKTSENFDITCTPNAKSFCKPIYIPSNEQFEERTPIKGASTAYDMVAEFNDTPSSCNVPQSCQSTPAYDDQVAGYVIAETPIMQTPKRPILSPTEIFVSMNEKTVSETKSTPSVRRTLLYSPQKLDLCTSNLEFDSEEQTQVHEHSLDETLSSKRTICAQEKNISRDTLAGSNDAQKLTQSNSEKRQALLYCLPAMFDTIHFICQSVDCSLITKQELVHKIISNNLDIEETSEVEEQLGLLEELVPDWMSKKCTYNGEFFYCIKRVPDPNTVRIRLSETACK